MQIRSGEKRTHKVVNETVNGLNVLVNLVSSVNNTQIPDTQYITSTAFDASNILIDVILKRNGKSFTMISTNLAILAHFSTLEKGANQFYKGHVTKPRGTNEKEQVVRSVFIPFYGHHNIKGSDELIVTATVGRDAFNTGVDKNESSVLVTTNQSIGYETGIFKFESYALQAHQSTETINLGDNVMKVGLLSFERDYLKPIFKSASLTSDRLDWTLSDTEIRLKHYTFFPANYVDGLIRESQDNKPLVYFPNSFLVHSNDEIDQGKISVNMEAPNIESSLNLVAWISYETSAEILQKATQMALKHAETNAEKIPEKVV
ncbi:hypothetical protein ACR79P_06485 [Sphingobacterium spiritivorum]|uniref:hypothetical protein n=1 Tax=Sphingobacterium spiritivorum TaxID=258 RepID=UPI003DA1D339